MKKQWRSFEDAREYVRLLGIRNLKEWQGYSKSGNRPNDIPANPNKIYKDEWISFGDWLGTGSIANKNKEFLPFEEARENIRSLGLKSHLEWLVYCFSKQRPNDIPHNPDVAYKDKWISWGDWLGTTNIAFKDKEWRPFLEAREYVCNLKLKNARAWSAYCKSGEKPADIPCTPNLVYKEEWINWMDWLSGGKPRWLPFEEAREYIRSLGLKSVWQWYVYSTSKQRPKSIPANPHRIYKGEFKGYGDWFGTGNVTLSADECRSFEEARNYVRNLRLKGWTEWHDYCESSQKPNDIPFNPFIIYKGKWNGMRDWLGLVNA